MPDHKRSFPYHSQVHDIGLKRSKLGSNNPGHDVNEYKVFSAPQLAAEDRQVTATDFNQWTDEQIKSFLDQRGEDWDPVLGRNDLVALAVNCEQQTGPAAPPQQPNNETAGEADDPLDAFMAEMNQLAEAQPDFKPKKPKADLDDDEDNVADFIEARARQGHNNVYVAEGYNSDDEVYATEKAITANQEQEPDERRPEIGPLAPLEHDDMEYQPFAKDFYTPVPKIASLTAAEVNTMRRQLGIRVSGFDVPHPVESFEQCGLEPLLMAAIRACKYEKPTGIQAQAIPAALSGRDILGIAKTGSGKTASFVIPMVVHVQDQPQLEKGEGPIGVVVAPTRELAEQIHKETRKLAKPFNMTIATGIGGLSKTDQFRSFKSGADMAICTPGRLIDLIKMKACKLNRTTFLVFDEADRMFDMGFEPQVRSIVGQIRPDRQTLLFSATMPQKIEKLVRDALTSPVRVNVGELGAANEDIKQVVEIVPDSQKVQWLLQRLSGMIDSGEVLVFVNQIVHVEEVLQKIKEAHHKAVAIHGDMDQHSRAVALKEFSTGRQQVLVATDVAARGLDIKSIKNVVNLDAAKDIDTHIHRVGRTGRAGDKEGVAYTLLTPKQTYFAGQLVNSMVAANQEISPALQSLAMKDHKFKKGQTRQKKGTIPGMAGAKRRGQVGGAGIGFGPSKGADDAGVATMQELYGDRTEFTKGNTPVSGITVLPPKSAAGASQAAPVAGRTTLGGPYGAARSQPAPPQQAPEGFKAATTPYEAVKTVPPKAASQPEGSGGVFGGQGFKDIMANKFMSQFVASGSTGGEQSQKATIIAPKSSKPQQPSSVPSFLAKKVNNTQNSAQAQQALAAARAIAERLSGAAPGSAAQPSDASLPGPPAAPPSFSRQSGGQAAFPVSSGRPSYGGGRGGGRGGGHGGGRHGNAPAGLGSSASAYPDLSSSRGGDSDSDSSTERRHRRSSRRDSDWRDSSHRDSDNDHSARRNEDYRQSNQQNHSSYGPPSSGSAAPSSTHAQPYHSNSQTQAAYGQATSHQPPSYAPSMQQQPPNQPHYSQYSQAAPPQYAQPSYPSANQYQQAAPGPPAGGAPNLQASIAAAQAIAARLSAQAGGSTQGQAPSYADPSRPQWAPPLPQEPPPQPDSVQAAIEAAKAIAARMNGSAAGQGQGRPTLGSTASNSSGQWAWRRG